MVSAGPFVPKLVGENYAGEVKNLDRQFWTSGPFLSFVLAYAVVIFNLSGVSIYTLPTDSPVQSHTPKILAQI